MDVALKKSRMKLKTKRNLIGYLFALPSMIMFAIFVIIPLVMAVVISLYKTDNFFLQMDYQGFANFSRVFGDKDFGKSLVNILLYTLMAVPLNILFSLLLALLLDRGKKGTTVFRVFFYLPSVTSTIAASIVWMYMMKPSSAGLLNAVLGLFNIPPQLWLTSSDSALVSVVLVTVWMGLGGNMLIFLAALQGLPQEIYEAARIDGASPIRCFFKLTIPFIAPTMFFILTMTLIGSFQLYDQVFMLTAGGPSGATWTPVYLIWQNAFGNSISEAGYAAAQSFVLFVIIMIVTFVVRYSMRFVNSEV